MVADDMESHSIHYKCYWNSKERYTLHPVYHLSLQNNYDTVAIYHDICKIAN